MRGKFDWKSAYFHLVSLTAIITLMIAAIGVGHGVLVMLFPRLSLNENEWEQVASFEAFESSRPVRQPAAAPAGSKQPDSIAPAGSRSEAELRQLWVEHGLLVIEGKKRGGLWSLLQSLVMAIVVLPIFWWHRRAAKRLKINEMDADE